MNSEYKPTLHAGNKLNKQVNLFNKKKKKNGGDKKCFVSRLFTMRLQYNFYFYFSANNLQYLYSSIIRFPLITIDSRGTICSYLD